MNTTAFSIQLKITALVIGNDEYPKEKLRNAVNDANSITDIFTRLGYNTKKVLNVGISALEDEIDQFTKDIKGADAAIFYFAGHGFENEDRNYLAAIDIELGRMQSAIRTSYPLDDLLKNIHKAGAATNIVILDMCRNPLQLDGSRALGGRIAPIFAPKGTIIAFSTSPGSTASDGSAGNGRYTAALLHHLQIPHMPVEEVFKKVRNSVYVQSSGEQISWEHTSLVGAFVFNHGQLEYSSQIPYGEDVVRDFSYSTTAGSEFDDVISGMKSYNYYKQITAIELFNRIYKTTTKHQDFLFGRNLLQAAEGGSFDATQLITGGKDLLLKYFKGKECHLLNGALYEMFFDKYANFRFNDPKTKYLDQLYTLLDDPTFIGSKEFIMGQLLPYQSVLCYVPGINDRGVIIDITVENADEGDNMFIVNNVYIDGRSVLIDWQDPFDLDEDPYYRPILHKDLASHFASNLLIPQAKIKILCNLVGSDSSIFRFPGNKKLSTGSEIDRTEITLNDV